MLKSLIDPATDITVLKVEAENLTDIDIGDSDQVEVGIL